MQVLTKCLIFLSLAWLILLSGCYKKQKLFEPVHSEESGISFRNDLVTNDTLNGVVFEYVYNGAGVAAGDVNNDGLDDLFFAGNLVSSRLYLNLGGFKFRDVTEEAGVSTEKWCTGTSFVDINDDGLLDLYICVAGMGNPADRKNIFFINQGLDKNGIPQFRDMAEEMNLDDDAYSTMAVFLDYDKDNDLDVYILTNAMESKLRNALRPRRVNGEGPSNDKLYRNEGNGTFTDVSREAGILQEGYGLGVGLCDLNQDGWTDVYCSNDFLSNDLLWINNGDGTFSEQSAIYFKHFTNNGMGMDIADYNNDGLLDVYVLDMLPMSNQRQKQMIGYRNLTRFYEGLELGYHPQFLRNTLQLNRGRFPDGQFRFSEIGYLAGVHQTDWSWSPLLVDYDNDGWKDLSVTNGYRKDVTNLDYIYFTLRENWMFGTPEANKAVAITAMNELPDVKLPNFIFGNNRDLTFSDKSGAWGLDIPTFTNGTAYTDLDNDGDFDLVVNNIDQEALIFRNLANESMNHHYLKLKFAHGIADHHKIGLKAWTFHGDNAQYHEYSPYRGYKSTVAQEIIIGLGNSTVIDSLVVQWPDGQVNTWRNLVSDTVLVLERIPDNGINPGHAIPELQKNTTSVFFEDISDSCVINVKHTENSRIDLDQVPIIMHNLGQYGPGIAVGDVNNDGLDDIYTGNDSQVSGHLLIQKPDGTFEDGILPGDSVYEDMGALFFDADSDGDLDLYVVSGGSNWPENDPRYQDRLYLNDGAARFLLAENALPEIRSSGSCVTAADYDSDGDLDLFIGGRLLPNRYPSPPKSFLLENEKGKFKDVSEKLGNSQGYIGMITSALWTDIDEDGRSDLILTGEYMPITVFLNQEDKFVDHTEEAGLANTHGWWNSLNGADLDLDGDIDYVAGNYGLNSFYKPTADQPVEIYAGDYDQNGLFDPITTVYIQDESYILHPRNLMIDQIPSFEQRFRTFEKYSTTPFNRSFTREEIEGSIHLRCNMLYTVVLEKLADKTFRLHRLPLQAQFSPVYGIGFEDFNDDGLPDLLLTGNSFAEETVYGYYDASFGTALINRGDFSWKCLQNNHINLITDGDKKAFSKIRIDDQTCFVLTENGGYLQILTLKYKVFKNSIPIRPDDWYAVLSMKDGNKQKVEFYYGNGYLSQNTRYLDFGNNVKDIEITRFNGESRSVQVGYPISVEKIKK